MLQASHQISRSPHCQQRRLQHWTLTLHSLCTTLQQASPSGHSRTGRSRPRACPQHMQRALQRQAPAKARQGVLILHDHPLQLAVCRQCSAMPSFALGSSQSDS